MPWRVGVIALIVFALALGALRWNGSAIDRIRRSDPEAAARIEMQRAEHGGHGGGNPYGGAGI